MIKRISAVLVAVGAIFLPAAVPAQEEGAYEGPVIDVHLHAARAGDNGPPGGAVCEGMAADLRYTGEEPWPVYFTRLTMEPRCARFVRGPMTDAEVLEQTVAAMRERQVIGILSSDAEGFATWSAAAPDLFLRGMSFSLREGAPTAEDLRAAYAAGDFAVLAEVTNQYLGVLADDPAFDAYWAMAEEEGIPVGIHLGPGPPGSPALFPQFAIQRPTQIEPVLRRHPRLRVYLMHAGYPFTEDLKAMLYFYPQLYVDSGVLQIAATREDYYAFLEELVRAGFGDRIMFGSDQMNWPGLIGEGIDAINTAPFLSHEQKRAILHDNAARFFAPELAEFAGDH